MTNFERAAQLWSVLALAARNQEILSYRLVEQLTGVPRVGVGKPLSPIQSYCKQEKLPPLTSIVVLEETGLPGVGFTGADLKDIVGAQARVFVFDWLGHGAPTVKELEDAYNKS